MLKDAKRFNTPLKWKNNSSSAYSKAIKVIESIENEGQWETGYRMVEIFGERFLGDWVNPSLDLPFNRERHNELLSLIRIKYKALKRKQTVR
jgi:hypothetical protein